MMRRLICALLFGLLLVPVPLRAQSVTLTVCNTGTVDLDAIFSGRGQVLDSRVRPRTCAAVAKSEGGGMEPGYLGLAFTDSRGQYGAARRFASPNTLTLADGSRNVQRRNVSVPLQLLFQPRLPVCERVPTGSEVIGNTTFVEVTNVCEDLGYTLLVETHLDSHEISLEFESISGVLSLNNRRVTFSEKPVIDWAGEEAKRKAREAPEAVQWSDLLPTLRRYVWPKLFDVLPKNIAIRGTVSRVDVNPGFDVNKNSIQVVNVVFRESPVVPNSRNVDLEPYAEFNVCTLKPDILQEAFGADFRTSMIGKSIKVRGEPGTFCRGTRGSIEITLGRQVRPIPSAQFAADVRVWVPPPVVVPPERPAPTSAQIEADLVSRATYATSDVAFQAEGRMRAACVRQAEKAYSDRGANQAAINQATAACMQAAKVDAREEAQKAQACALQVIRADANPDGSSRDFEGLQRALLACRQAAASGPTAGPAPVAAPAQPVRQ
jgi:hypothetical protein